MPTPKELHRGLNLRHIQFLALGSSIGTGLFYGSNEAIKLAGPAVLAAYLLAGFFIFVVMRSLGELILNTPEGKSFGDYITIHVNPKWGFITGWAYILEMVIVCIADLTAFGIYMQFWFPTVAPWIWIAVAIGILGLINLQHIRIFGEVEFWLNIIKILALTAMILGGLYLLARNEVFHQPMAEVNVSLGNLVDFGGFWANGMSGLILCFPIVLFSFGGIEIIGLTALEAKNPTKAIPMAINSVPFRIIFFYVLTIFTILTIIPWTKLDNSQSPFVLLFSYLGLDYGASILNVVVISASISAINSDIFSASRMLYSLAGKGDAPRWLGALNKNHLPWKAVLMVGSILCLSILLNYLFPKEIFVLIAAAASFITIFVWIMILIAQLKMRQALGQKTSVLFKAFGFPWLQISALGFFSFVILTMLYLENTRICVFSGVAILMGIFLLRQFSTIKLRGRNQCL